MVSTWSAGTGSSGGMSRRGEHVAQALDGGRAAEGVERGRPFELVARVEQHRAALTHVGVDARHRGGTSASPCPGRSASRSAGRTRARRARDRRRSDRRARARCASARTPRQAGKSGAAGGVDLGVAGDDIGEVGLADRFQRELVAGLVGAARGRRQTSSRRRRRQPGGPRLPPSGGGMRSAPFSHSTARASSEQQQHGERQQPRREVGGRGGRIGAHAGVGHVGDVEGRQCPPCRRAG